MCLWAVWGCFDCKGSLRREGRWKGQNPRSGFEGRRDEARSEGGKRGCVARMVNHGYEVLDGLRGVGEGGRRNGRDVEEGRTGLGIVIEERMEMLGKPSVLFVR